MWTDKLELLKLQLKQNLFLFYFLMKPHTLSKLQNVGYL